ncbi:MAG: chromosome segregation protein SMC [Clostridiales bacterium]|nr:chromosome segregation protein SMC [Clostridiales bacterium]
MRLTKLEIYGFKSFAKRTEIVFPQNVTGIVGPNGSGKSNISDAVRWVLGEQSAKTLRGNSMADVIFNGTEKRKPMNYCEVTLVFDNSDLQLPVEYQEVSITRRVYRSGDSEYLMNGSNCRLKDIVDLFRDTGVGKEGYSIIGQGRIDEILSQRGEDRRIVFEEAVGINRFRSRKEEAETRLKRADENLVRVVDVLDELETHLAPLKRQAEVAREYLSLSEALKELDIRLFIYRYDRLHQKEVEAEQALLRLKDSLAEAEKQLTQAIDRRTQGEAHQEELQQALSQAHEALLRATDSLHGVKENAATIENRLISGQETLDRLDKEENSLNNRLRLIEATMTQSDGGLSEATRLQELAQAELDKCRENQTRASEAAEALEEKLDAHKNRMMERMNRMQNVRASQARNAAMQQQMAARRSELITQQEQEALKDEELLAAVNAARDNLQGEEKRLEELKAAAQEREEAPKRMLQQILAKQKEMQEDAQNARAADMRLRTLKELQDGYEGYQYAVKNALTYARREKMTGVVDVVAMLLHVPREYETAMDMALGAGMQNIVTETEQEAKQLVEYLRENRMGRATFLPVNTVRGRTLSDKERQVLSMEGCIGVASELCSYEERYRGIVENLLGRTVVARDLDSGIAIMRAGGHAFRLVTLTGDVMHSGGSITGGSIQQKAQNLLGREREMKELGNQLKEINQRVSDAQKLIEELERQRAEEKKLGESALYEVHQQEIAVVRDSERLKSATADRDAHLLRRKALEEAIAQLDETLEEIEAEAQRIRQMEQQDDVSDEELSAITVELSGQLNLARREREKAQEALTGAMLTLQNAQHDLDRIQRDRSRLEHDSHACRKELFELQNRRTQTLQEMERNRKAKEAVLGSIAQAETAVDDSRRAVEDTEQLRDECQRSLKEIQSEIDAAQQVTGRETERLHRQEMALGRMKNDVSLICDRLWDTYELSYAGAMEQMLTYPQQEKPFKESEAEGQAQGIRERIRAMGSVNVGAIEEYAQMNQRYTQLTEQRNDLEKAKKDLQELITQLLGQMETVFVSQFGLLQDYFAQTFTRLFGGGRGEISLSDPEHPLDCGIDIIVQPPGKKRQILSLFSGGERALTAIAILFAMLKLKPTPFCILDEIEAALDDANISYFADYLKEFSIDTQFIVVTHRKGTMERCDTLFGVAMEERGISSMVSVNLTDYE